MEILITDTEYLSAKIFAPQVDPCNSSDVYYEKAEKRHLIMIDCRALTMLVTGDKPNVNTDNRDAVIFIAGL